jgi:ribosome biogenesis GTPase
MRPDDTRAALVLSVGRNSAWVVFDDESRAMLASLRKQTERMSLVPGDRVMARSLDDDRVIVERREPRSYALVRRTGGGRERTMAANVDTVAIVAAFERPPLHFAMIDELLAFAELHELRALLLLTKPDLVADESVAAVLSTYKPLGYSIFVVNPKAGIGTDAVAGALADRHTLLIGQSGVGKSSLFRSLGGESVVGDLSKTGQGRQTTTSARLLRFPAGFLIDSPGVGEFELSDTSPREVAYGFLELRSRAGECRFTDCTHRTEPDCAVRAAVATGAISPSRYDSYLAIVSRPERELPDVSDPRPAIGGAEQRGTQRSASRKRRS